MIANVHEAKTNFSKLLEKAHAGEEIILAKSGKPYARMVPLNTTKERVPGRYPSPLSDQFFDPLDDSELSAWEG